VTLRKRMEKSKLLEALLSGILASYMRFCFLTTRWQKDGLEELQNALQSGPVILVCWHSRLFGATLAWPRKTAPLSTLRDPSPAGRLSAATQRRLGLQPHEMAANSSNIAASRSILKLIRDGRSLGLTADGPEGPARQAKTATIEWARATGVPVFLFAWSARRAVRLNTWDRLLLPMPFTRGAYGFRRWRAEVPRRLDASATTALQTRLTASLDTWMHDMDARCDRPPGD